MERSEIIEIIKTVISEETEISKEEIQENSLLMRDLELSSMEVLTIIGRLEEKLSVYFVANEMNKITTINELADYISSSVDKKA